MCLTRREQKFKHIPQQLHATLKAYKKLFFEMFTPVKIILKRGLKIVRSTTLITTTNWFKFGAGSGIHFTTYSRELIRMHLPLVCLKRRRPVESECFISMVSRQ